MGKDPGGHLRGTTEESLAGRVSFETLLRQETTHITAARNCTASLILSPPSPGPQIAASKWSRSQRRKERSHRRPVPSCRRWAGGQEPALAGVHYYMGLDIFTLKKKSALVMKRTRKISDLPRTPPKANTRPQSKGTEEE